MYDLGEQFRVDYSKAIPNPDSIIQGNTYRITVLTERLIRLEYSKDGIFEDRPTERVSRRNLKKPKFEVKEDEKFLEIKTSYFRLMYVKEKPFYGGKVNPTANLKVELVNTDRFWYYKHPEVRNYGAPNTLIEISGKKKVKSKSMKGLYSLDGFTTIDDSKGRILLENGEVIERDKDCIDIYLFCYIKDFYNCLKDYFEITGYPALIPRYALGNWWSRDYAYNDLKLKQLVDNFYTEKIPLSVILLDKDWHRRPQLKNRLGDSGFTFNNEYFKAPYDMISYLHSHGIRIGLNVNPIEGIYPIDDYYERAKQYIQADEAGVIPYNILNPRFVDVYFKLFIHPLDALGVDFFFIDYNNQEKMSDMFLLKRYHFEDMTRNYKRRPMILAYNTDINPHRYPVVYSGRTVVSWETLKKIPFHNASATNIGMTYWAHDIGGYHEGIEDDELYIRFVQLGVFSPILKFGSAGGKYYKREPWRWDIKTATIVKQYLTLRHKLIPYLYSEAYQYSKFGKPLLEPIYYRYPYLYDDVLYRNEYYLGNEFFVAPIISKKEQLINRVIHKFYLPEGIWYDFVTGKKFPGGKEYVSFFRDEDYPVFVRAGSIIPLGYNENINDTTPPKNLEINIFPGQSNTYNLYEDDGVSSLYKKGFFLNTSIEYNYLPNNYTVIIRAVDGKSGIVPERRNYKLVFRNTKAAKEVIVYENSLPVENFKTYVEGPNFVVEVNDIKTIGQLTVNCKGKDIEIDAVRLINQDIENIISDLHIETRMKEMIDAVLFGELPIKKKRIEIRKLARKGLERKYVKLFLKLLEYIEQV